MLLGQFSFGMNESRAGLVGNSCLDAASDDGARTSLSAEKNVEKHGEPCLSPSVGRGGHTSQ